MSQSQRPRKVRIHYKGQQIAVFLVFGRFSMTSVADGVEAEFDD